jgi:heavy metal translocating P-type ATPase
MSHAASTTNAHSHTHTGIDCCSHHELQIDRYIVLYLVGGVLALVSLIASWTTGRDNSIITVLPAVVGAILLGMPLFIAAVKEVLAGRISSSSLAALAILAAMAVSEYITAAFLAFILLVADQIVRRTAFGAQRAIEALVKLTPDRARLVDADGTERDVSISQLALGALVRVRPGENLPVDGRVRSGRSTINQASLTGEAMPVEADPGAEVYAGTTNLTGIIDIEVTRLGDDTTIGKVTSLIREAERAKSPRQLLIEQVARFYVPVALSVALLVFYLFSQNPETKDIAALTAVTVLVVTCPTALLLSSPSAMVAAFASAARLGVMVKRTSYLESAANIDAVVLDKTGTMTTGKFEVSRLAPADGVDAAELLRAAATGEQHSNHPLALSILRTAEQARVRPDATEQVDEVHGRGVRTRTADHAEIAVGRSSFIRELAPHAAPEIDAVEAKIDGMSGVHVLRAGRYLGAVGLEDKVRPNARATIERLRDLGVRFVSIFTGDRLGVAKRVGLQTSVDAVEAECLPEEKHELVRDMARQGYRVLMVGDGINDGPALAEADVGVAMGLSGSDIAANSAGVALMTDELNRLPFLIELARKTRAIVTQNIAVSILMAIVGLVLAATGTFVGIGGDSRAAAGIGVGIAALFHFAPDVFVIGNSFRLFRFGEDFLAAESRAKADADAANRARRSASIRGLSAQTA